MFRKKLNYALEGNRVGMLIKNLEVTHLEREIACGENYTSTIKTCSSGIFLIKKVKYYRLEITYGSKFYLNCWKPGVNGKYSFFGDN